jgi:hypothetical protein
VSTVTVDHVFMSGTTSGIRTKAARDRGGLALNRTYSHMTLANLQNPVYITSYDPMRSTGLPPRRRPGAADLRHHAAVERHDWHHGGTALTRPLTAARRGFPVTESRSDNNCGRAPAPAPAPSPARGRARASARGGRSAA